MEKIICILSGNVKQQGDSILLGSLVGMDSMNFSIAEKLKKR